MNNFKVGDRVIFMSNMRDSCADIEGERGFIRVIDKDEPKYGVVFDRNVGGQSLRGLCQMGHGVWVEGENLVKEYDNIEKFLMSDEYSNLVELLGLPPDTRVKCNFQEHYTRIKLGDIIFRTEWRDDSEEAGVASIVSVLFFAFANYKPPASIKDGDIVWYWSDEEWDGPVVFNYHESSLVLRIFLKLGLLHKSKNEALENKERDLEIVKKFLNKDE